MTVLTDWYAKERRDGLGHRAALRHLARRLGVDPDTLLRQLHRADPNRFSKPKSPKETT